MEFHASDWSDLIVLRPSFNAVLHFFCRKDPMLSTAIVARPAKAGMKAVIPLFTLKEDVGKEVLEKFENQSTESGFCLDRSDGVRTNDSLDLGTLDSVVLLLYFSRIPLSAIVRFSFSNCWISLCL